MKRKSSVVLLVIPILSIIIFVGYYLFRPQSIPVLAYHDFSKAEDIDPTDTKYAFVDNIENFEKQMKYIYNNGYKTLSMDEFYCWKTRKCKLPKKSVLITFDDGNVSIYKYVLPILKKYDLKGTSFIIGSRTLTDSADSGYLTLNQIEQIKTEYPNLEFHSHTFDLHQTKNGQAVIKVSTIDELNVDIKNIEDILDTQYVAYPFGSYTEDYISALKENDYRLGFLYKAPFVRATQENDNFKVPRVTIDRRLQFWRFKLALKIGLPSKTNIIPK